MELDARREKMSCDMDLHYEGQNSRQQMDRIVSISGERWHWAPGGYGTQFELNKMALNGSIGARCSFFFCVAKKKTITVNLEPGTKLPWDRSGCDCCGSEFETKNNNVLGEPMAYVPGWNNDDFRVIERQNARQQMDRFFFRFLPNDGSQFICAN